MDGFGQKVLAMATATYPHHHRIISSTKITCKIPNQLRSRPLRFKGHAFAMTDDILLSLEDQGVHQLYPKGPKHWLGNVNSRSRTSEQCRKQAVEDIKRRIEEARRLLKESIGTLEDTNASFVLK
ncbi:Mediator complex, subunit Med7 [Prunus dulcis]|uniref:Mediator complex, subunit Med7 n=1 Tax=Prunus dulcis TaxID=3755 RepID=A0A4Y1QYM2_PRUDU|nr:Mediator complex, subunit Med7 [Prunus dulcis]